MLRCGSDPDCTESGFCWLPCAAELCLLDGLHFLLNICKKHTVIKCNFSPEAKGKELLPGCNEEQSPALYFLQNNSHGTSRAFFPLFSTSLNFYRYSAVKSFTHSHVS